ncbi:hypothetical protein [Empedobacter falsenii]|uniref:hypothetical protein n=1 Tax=Empedobacter falsenii TaxID=343874 RepID=UPI00056F66EF|nr:hypothetical protein [Empedobacter falsenii]
MTFRELTISVLAKRYLHPFDSLELVKWSIEILKIGYETENLYILAGLDDENTIVREDYFFKSLNDLNFIIDNKESILKEYAFYISKKFLNSKISEFTAIGIMNQISNEFYFDDNLTIFQFILSDLIALKRNGNSAYLDVLNPDNKTKFIQEEFQEYYSKYKPIYEPN